MASAKNENAEANAIFDRRQALVIESAGLYHTYLVNYVRGFAPEEYAKDVVQELWKYVILSFPEDKIQNVGLLRKKAYQLFIDNYRKAKALSQAKEKLMLEPEREHGEAAFSAKSEDELKERFWLEYDVGLTPEQKEVVWHHARYGMTFEEIETALGIKASTACDWMKTARTKISQKLNNEE
jgi:RNA polymerase sigma factor (sigma-70 family)